MVEYKVGDRVSWYSRILKEVCSGEIASAFRDTAYIKVESASDNLKLHCNTTGRNPRFNWGTRISSIIGLEAKLYNPEQEPYDEGDI